MDAFSTITDLKVLCGPVDDDFNRQLYLQIQEGWTPYGSPALAIGQCGHIQIGGNAG